MMGEIHQTQQGTYGRVPFLMMYKDRKKVTDVKEKRTAVPSVAGVGTD